jgi:hypothetical protein
MSAARPPSHEQIAAYARAERGALRIPTFLEEWQALPRETQHRIFARYPEFDPRQLPRQPNAREMGQHLLADRARELGLPASAAEWQSYSVEAHRKIMAAHPWLDPRELPDTRTWQEKHAAVEARDRHIRDTMAAKSDARIKPPPAPKLRDWNPPTSNEDDGR